MMGKIIGFNWLYNWLRDRLQRLVLKTPEGKEEFITMFLERVRGVEDGL